MSVRVLACVDQHAGLEVLRYLTERPEVELVGVITHPDEVAVCGPEVTLLCARARVPRYDIETARRKFPELIAPLAPDYLVAAYFDYLLDERFLRLPKAMALGLHPGFVPYDRGVFAPVWAAIDGTPPGVSVHVLSADGQSGDLLAQKRLTIEPQDTGDTLYDKHEREALSLFRASWPAVLAGNVRPQRQRVQKSRRPSSVRRLSELDPDERTTIRELVERLRLGSSIGGGCSVDLMGGRYRVRIGLEPLDD
jgi:methionyl-tRNA formyltransferase